MENLNKDFEFIQQALDKANQRGVYNLAESSSIVGAIVRIGNAMAEKGLIVGTAPKPSMEVVGEPEEEVPATKGKAKK
jgi:hypothetical protein